jgi:hypothetical protein
MCGRVRHQYVEHGDVIEGSGKIDVLLRESLDQVVELHSRDASTGA